LQIVELKYKQGFQQTNDPGVQVHAGLFMRFDQKKGSEAFFLGFDEMA
jgi:hypothetical protein